jgi:hypothetical protein
LPHPHYTFILIEQRRRLNCLRLACTTAFPHVLANIILIRKLSRVWYSPQCLGAPPTSYSFLERNRWVVHCAVWISND